MTPFGKSVTLELQAALVAVQTASIINYRFVPGACEALVTNALFYVRKTKAIESARGRVFEETTALAQAIEARGIDLDGTSPAVEAARAHAATAFQALIEVIADAQVTPVGHILGVA